MQHTSAAREPILMAQWICHHIAIHTGVTVVANNETIVYSGVETCQV